MKRVLASPTAEPSATQSLKNMDDSELAKNILEQGEDTVVFVRGGEILSSKLRGVRPLLDFLDAGVSFSDGAAADRVVGRGAAFLHVLLHTKTLYAAVLSRSAEEVLQRFSVSYTFGTRVDFIRNRSGEGRCPMEETTERITDPIEALAAIRKKLATLHS